MKESAFVASALINPFTLEIYEEDHYILEPGDELRCFIPATGKVVVRESPVSLGKKHVSVVGFSYTDVEAKFDAILMRGD